MILARSQTITFLYKGDNCFHRYRKWRTRWIDWLGGAVGLHTTAAVAQQCGGTVTPAKLYMSARAGRLYRCQNTVMDILSPCLDDLEDPSILDCQSHVSNQTHKRQHHGIANPRQQSGAKVF
jgi:hypothetical protein